MKKYTFREASSVMSIPSCFDGEENFIFVEDNINDIKLRLNTYNRQNIILRNNLITVLSKNINLVVTLNGNDNTLNVAEDVTGSAHFVFSRGGGCLIGRNTSLNSAKFIVNFADVAIGEDCMFSDEILIQSNEQHALYCLETGTIIKSHRRFVILEDHVWVGRRACIMPDVHVGKGAIIGGSSCVTKSVQAFSCVAGVPAREVRSPVSWFRNPTRPSELEKNFFRKNGHELTIPTLDE